MKPQEAIILCGGFGTRLKPVMSDLPKPMAKIGNKHFLEYVLSFLQRSGIKHVILSVGYKAAIIQNYFNDTYHGLRISYSMEEKQLGTGGAVVFSLRAADDEDVIIMNGDTMFPVPINDLYEYHCAKRATLTMALKEINKKLKRREICSLIMAQVL